MHWSWFGWKTRGHGHFSPHYSTIAGNIIYLENVTTQYWSLHILVCYQYVNIPGMCTGGNFECQYRQTHNRHYNWLAILKPQACALVESTSSLLSIEPNIVKTRLLGRPQPQMYPPVALNQYTLVNRTHKHYIYICFK